MTVVFARMEVDVRIVLVSREFEPRDVRLGARATDDLLLQYLSPHLASTLSPFQVKTNLAVNFLRNPVWAGTLGAKLAASDWDLERVPIDAIERVDSGLAGAVEQKKLLRKLLVEHAGDLVDRRERPVGPADDLGGVSGIVGDVLNVIDYSSLVAPMLGSIPMGGEPLGRLTALHLVDQVRARKHLGRQGGGILEDGAYVLHPKRPGVLVPLATYHAELLGEMQREARVLLGRLGAKMLKIETVEGVTFGGQVVSRFPGKAGAAGVASASTESRTVTYEWHSPTFDPDHALEGCVLVQDNTGVMTLVGQRQTSDLKRYEEYSKIDTSFGVDLAVMAMFNASFEWASTSTYRYEVEFFPKS